MTTNQDPLASLVCSAEEAAQLLLGCVLECTVGGALVRVRIVETEAYDQTDEGSHTFRGRTNRNATMFGEHGHMYVYFTYGMHYCCNIVAGEAGYGAGVLIRAVEPLEGVETIQRRRGKQTGKNLTNGPGKVCQALGIDLQYNGHNLKKLPIKLVMNPPLASSDIVRSKRIGLSKAIHTPWRFYIRDNVYVSKK